MSAPTSPAFAPTSPAAVTTSTAAFAPTFPAVTTSTAAFAPTFPAVTTSTAAFAPTFAPTFPAVTTSPAVTTFPAVTTSPAVTTTSPYFALGVNSSSSSSSLRKIPLLSGKSTLEANKGKEKPNADQRYKVQVPFGKGKYLEYVFGSDTKVNIKKVLQRQEEIPEKLMQFLKKPFYVKLYGACGIVGKKAFNLKTAQNAHEFENMTIPISQATTGRKGKPITVEKPFYGVNFNNRFRIMCNDEDEYGIYVILENKLDTEITMPVTEFYEKKDTDLSNPAFEKITEKHNSETFKLFCKVGAAIEELTEHVTGRETLNGKELDMISTLKIMCSRLESKTQLIFPHLEGHELEEDLGEDLLQKMKVHLTSSKEKGKKIAFSRLNKKNTQTPSSGSFKNPFESDSESEPKPETKSKSKAETKSETKSKSKAETKSETKTKSKAETKTKSKAETKTKSKAETKSKSKTQTELEPESESQPLIRLLDQSDDENESDSEPVIEVSKRKQQGSQNEEYSQNEEEYAKKRKFSSSSSSSSDSSSSESESESESETNNVPMPEY